MARLKGILQLEGSAGGLSFYKMGGVTVVRQGWGPDKQRMRKDPAFERARENGKEFGAWVKDGKLLRGALWPFLKSCADKELTPRVNKLMFALKNLDGVSKRGERCVAKGTEAGEAAKLLKDFLFNKEAALGNVLKKVPKTDIDRGQMKLDGFLAKRDLVYPKGASHAQMQAGIARIDFEAKRFVCKDADVLSLSKKDAARDLVFKIPELPVGKGIQLIVLSIRFFQKVNGELCALSNSQFNTCGVVGVGY